LWTGGLEHISIGADRREAIAADSDRLGGWLGRRHRNDRGVVVDDVRRLGLRGQSE